MLWQLRKLSTNEALSEAGPLPNNWGPIFGMENMQGQLGDLSWLGEDFVDQGWVQVEEEKIITASPAILAWEKAKQLLSQSDWSVLPDVPMTVEERQSWKDYRAKLRDIRMQSKFPSEIAWPTKPE